MYTRDYHKKQFVKHRSQYHWKHYEAARNKVTTEMRKSKSNYFQQKIKDCEKIDPKATWKLINSLVGKSHKSNHVTEIEYEGKNTVDGSEISEAFNDYFINIGQKLAAESTSSSSNNVHKYLKTNELNYPFLWSGLFV